jgi:hypothetical protein
VALKPIPAHKKGLQTEICKPLKFMVRQAGLEPAKNNVRAERS